MVAVSIVVVALTLTAIDMKQDLLKRCLLVTLLMLIITTGAALATLHPVIGLAINFTIILIIIYQLFDHYKGSYYFPFLISYIFLLMSAPSTLDQLPKRAISVLFGCLYVFLIQLVFNRKRHQKTIAAVEGVILEDLNSQLNLLLEGQKDDTLYDKVNHMIPVILKSIDDNKIQGHYLSSANKCYTKLIIVLDNLNQILYRMDSKNIESKTQYDFLLNLQQLLKLIKDYLRGLPEDQYSLAPQIKELIERLNNSCLPDELSDYMSELKDFSLALTSLQLTKDEPIEKKYSLLKQKWRDYNLLSYNFKFALKAAASISLTIFLVEVCHITYGRWIIFPMIAIIQPYYDSSLQKAKHRISGTLLGMLLFTVLFTFIKDPTLRLNVTILTAYIGVFITKYQYSTALVAISALGSTAIQGAGIEILYYRLLFTIVGCLLALLINRFIFHYKYEHIKEDLNSELLRIKKELTSLPALPQYELRKYHLLLDQKLIQCKLRTL